MKGCGKTFSVWLANTVKRLALTATQLWAFLEQVTTGVSKMAAFRNVGSDLSNSAPYRIIRRLH